MAKTMLAIGLLVGAGCSSGATATRTTPTTEPVRIDPVTDEHPTVPTTTTLPPTTTSLAPEPVEEAPAAPPATRARSAPTTVPYVAPEPAETGGSSAPLACIRSYEQGADGYATDTGNGYYGAYQFDMGTWASVGGTGNPADASPAEQDRRAEMLYNRRGLAPWPTPNAMCG